MKNRLYTGIDDATKCPCIGSIFLAGVVATQDTIFQWKKLGVKDSKLLTAKKREELASIIKKTATNFAIQQMTPQMIDNKSFNLNDWEMLTVLNIIQKLQKFSNLQEIYIDNWEVTLERFNERFNALLDKSIEEKLAQHNIKLEQEKLHSLHLIPEHRADENYTIVGAASILAKTSSDAQYKKYKKIYGNFGSGSPADPQTRLFVWQHRHNPPPIVRTSWNTYKTLIKLDAIEDDFLYARALKNKE